MATKRKRSKRESTGSSNSRKKKEDAPSKKDSGKKKGKKGSSSSSRNASASTKNNNGNDNPNRINCLVYNIIQRLIIISQSKQKCTGAIQAIPTASFLPPRATGSGAAAADDAADATDTGTASHVNATEGVDYNNLSHDANANIIIIATILLNVLLQQHYQAGAGTCTGTNSGNDDNVDVKVEATNISTTSSTRDNDDNYNTETVPSSSMHTALIQGIIANLLSIILMNDKSLLERTMNNHYHNRTSVSISASASVSASANASASTNVSGNDTVKNRDAKTLLSKSVLTVILSTIDSMKTCTSSAGTSNADADADVSNTSMDTDNTNVNKIQKAIWKNLSTLERILAIPKRKHSFSMGMSALSSSSTGAVTGGSLSAIGSSSSLGIDSNAAVLHIPVSSQHAHSISMNSRGLQEWNALCHSVDGSGNGNGNGIGGGGISSSSGSGAGTCSEFQLEDYVQECSIVSQAIGALEGDDRTTTTPTTTNTTKRTGTAASPDNDAPSCAWMKPFVMHASIDTEEEPAPPPTKRTRKSKASASAAAASTAARTSINHEEKLKEHLLDEKVIDGRIAVRKFSSMAFVHCCAGHYHLLDCLRNVLSDEEYDDGSDVDGDNRVREQEDDEDMGGASANKFGSWSEIMDPGTVRWETGSGLGLTSTKKAKKKKSSSYTDIAVTGSLSMSILSSRVIEIVQESGKLCGNFPSKHGMEGYIQDLYNVFDGVHGSDDASNSSASLHELRAKRPNIYNLVVVVLRLMLLNHEKCLMDIAESTQRDGCPFDLVTMADADPRARPARKSDQSNASGVVGHVLINEEEVVKDSIVKEYANYHPLMHKTIDSLIKCVNTSHTSTSKNESKILYAIAAAFAFRCSVVTHVCEPPTRERKAEKGTSNMPPVGSVVVVDAKLCSFAIHHFSEIVDHIIKLTKQSFRGDDVDSAAKDMSAAIIQNFVLDQPLLPDLASNQAGLFASASRTADADPNVESGDEKGWRNGFFLALFLRAMLPGKKKAVKAVVSRTPLNLVQRLLSVAQTCYAVKHETAITGKGRKRTRFTRCTLAADCFDAARKFITHIPYHTSISVGKAIMTVRLRAVMRKHINAEVVHCFVQLGRALEDILVGQRFSLCDEGDRSHHAATVSSMGHVEIGKLEYEQWERRLWSSHFKCCLSFARGSATYVSRISNTSPTMKRSIFGNSNEKLALFKAVADPEMRSEKKWPLYLSSSQHAIVSGILTCDPLPRTVKEASPERFICEGFIQSISEALKEPEEFILNAYNVAKNPRILVSDEEVPLSLRDARLFAVALSRTPRKEQLVLTVKLVDALHQGIAMIEENEDLRLLLMREQSYSGFVARTLTVCSTIIDMVSSGKLLLESLCDYIGPLHYHLPSFIEVEDQCDTSRQDCISDWYKRDSCFMSLWPDWEMASLPPVEVHTKIDPLPGDGIENYKRILDTALELGFQTAPNDMCHLAFSSWNASAKLCGVDNEVWTGPSTSNEMAIRSNPSKLTNIRKDICQIFYELVDDESSTPNSFLSLQLKRKRRRQSGAGRQGRGTVILDSAVNESIQMLGDFSTALNNGDEKSSPGDCVVMEATLSYISFLASMFTTSGTDLLSALIRRDRSRRKRKSSSFSGDSMNDHEMDDGCSEDSGSDGYHDFDDEEDEEEAQLDGITRLHDICDELGASPFHPDWLDTNCRLRPGITETTGVERAESMLRALTDFGLEAFTRYKRVLSDVIAVYVADDTKPTADGTSALAAICGIRNTENQTEPTTSNSSWQNDLAEVFNVDVSILQAIIQGLPCKKSDAVKESFALNSAHQIKGKLQDFLSSGNGWLPDASEYRAGGEFELLLSDALIGSCSTLDVSQPSDKGSSEEGKTSSDLHMQPTLDILCRQVLQWKRILRSSVDAMVTVNALLRFCLNGAKGRQQHRTMVDDTNTGMMPRSTYQTSPIRQNIRDRNAASLENLSYFQLKSTVNKSLCFLAEINSCGFSSRTIQQSARAATCHLVVSDSDLLNIEGVHMIRNALVAMKELSRGPNLQSGSSTKAALAKLVESMGAPGRMSNGFETKLLFCLGSATDLKMTTVVDSLIDLRSMLQKCGSNWDTGKTNSTEGIRFFTEVIQGQHENIASASVRSCIIGLLRDALDAEDRMLAQLDIDPKETVKALVLKHWCSLESNLLQGIVKSDICLDRSSENVVSDSDRKLDFEISHQICSLIVRLLGVTTVTDTDVETMLSAVMKALKDSMQHWVGEKELGHVMCIMCFLAMRFGNLNGIGQELLQIIKKTGSNQAERYLCGLEIFYRFLEDTRKALDGKFDTTKKAEQSSFSGDKCVAANSGNPDPKQKHCTFVSTHGEFTEQHWYNCYTCGLTWDKGCCSLCARVCHKGHDVGYSRKSSFFCDCGAEVKTNAGRISCKCLSPLTPSALALASDKDGQANHAISGNNCPEQSDGNFWNEAISITATHFRETARNSLQDFVKSIDASLIGDLFDTFNAQFDLWANEESMHSFLSSTSKENSTRENAEESRNELSILSRDGVHLEIEKLGTPSFSPLRMSRTNAINSKISTDLSISKSKKTLLTKNAVERGIVTTDSRGRLIVAEPKALLFCGALSLVNTRHASHCLESGLLRSQLCVLGTHKVDFGVVGVSVCPGRDRHLVTWGFTSARFLILTETCDKVDLSVNLMTGLETSDCDSNYIVKVEWVTGTILAIFCATSVKLYHIENNVTEVAGKVTCRPSLNYIMEFEDVLIRSGVIIPCDEEDDMGDEDEGKACNNLLKRIVILFDTGRLYMIDFALNSSGCLDCEGDISVEYGEGISFPIAGVKRYSGTNPEPAGSTAKSLGEGSCLVYMRQSNILLYKCISSAMVALTLNSHGDIVGNFEFLPHVIKSELLDQSEGDSLSGPYKNWTELGTVEDDSTFYRAAFVARSVGTNQPHLVHIEYNNERSRTRRLKMPGNVNLTMSMNSSYEGLSAFSGPFITGGAVDDGMITKEAMFYERAYLVSLTSNGILTFHGEEVNTGNVGGRKRTLSFTETVKFKDNAKSVPSFLLTTFETLRNITSADELIFSGDGVEENSSETKKKLSTGSNEYVVSPTKDGCTFIVSLQKSDVSKQGIKSAKGTVQDITNHVIVAVRLLLGASNTDFTPREVSIMGRSIKSTRDKKRWYDVPLTDEEIMIGVRTGFVSICIGGALEGDRSQVLVDSIEVYTEDRAKLPRLFPIARKKLTPSDSTLRPSFGDDVGNSRKSLGASIVIISHALQLLGGASGLLSNISEESLQRLIQVTALDPNEKGSVRNHVIELLKELESDPHTMQMLLDKGTLQGICNVLKDLDSVMIDITASIDATDESSNQNHSSAIPDDLSGKILRKVNHCLSASIAIVKERPMNYKLAIESLIASKRASSSIALHATKFVEKCEDCGIVVDTSSKLVELTMHEILSNPGDQTARSARSFANIEMLTVMLRSSNQSVVENCCETIAHVLKDLPAEVMLHKCDCCGILPITRRRYTMDEESYDIDLCQDCYNKGIAHAVLQDYSPHISVLVDNKTIHISGDKDLSCDEIRKMSSKVVPEEPIDAPTSATLRALIFDNLLTGVITDISTTVNLNRSNCIPVMDVLLTLVLQCSKVEEKIELGEAMCKMLCKEIAALVEQCVQEQIPTATIKKNRFAVVLFLRTLTSLITKQDKISLASLTTTMSDISPPKTTFQPSPAPASKSKTDPRFVCETHGVPAVRRRCSHGEHKDRRFYVCGMDRKNRCKYFKWADEAAESNTQSGNISARPKSALSQLDMSDSSEDIVIDLKLQSILWRQLNGGNPPLHKKLCNLLRNFIKKSKPEISVDEESTNQSSAPIVHKHLLSTLGGSNDQVDNGVVLSIEKLGFPNMPGGDQASMLTASKSVNLNLNEYLSVEASLDFLSLVASHSSDITQKSYASWEVWYSPLCYIISKESPARIKSRAKKMLKCITGGRRATYHQVRDRFVFASQFADLLTYCSAPLDAALFVRQKARQCGPQWRLSNATWDTLGTGGLLGAQALVSEDNYTITEMEKIIKVLDDLITITRSRSDNWRHFCALDNLPQKDSDLEIDSSVQLSEGAGLDRRSPICLLFWMACSLPGFHQVKLLQLIDIAVQRLPDAGASSYDEAHGIMSTDVGTDADAEGNSGDIDTPEKVLLSGASGLSMNDLCAFASAFVLNGDNADIRSHAKNIIQNLTIQSSADSLNGFFKRMATLCMTEVGPSGKQGTEFLQFLTNVVSNNVFMEGMSSNVLYLAKVAVACFVKQTATSTNVVNSPSNKNIFELKSKKDKSNSEKFDLTKCAYCQGCTDTATCTNEKANKTGCKWAVNQVSDYHRIRLDQHHAVSTEFSSYVQLKDCLSISEIFLSVSDQRGRFVKTIIVYFTPRPGNDINDLKDEHYDPLWQKCGTLSLSRGANKASCKLPSGVVAANLKFEYVDFYEKITGARTSSGAMVLHCPRCTRVVNNAHGGVCGHCGEVAFQCRKCRHINYDRLDAFLCVECGYCSSGLFSFELEAGEAISAVAIQDESDLENSLAKLHAKNKEYMEVKNLFKKHVSSDKTLAGSKRKQDAESISDRLEVFNGPLKRALVGELPKISISKSNTDKKKDAKRSETTSNRSSASTRARSLLSLARQLRGESEGDVRSSLGDILVQQARLSSGSRSSFPFDDADDDMMISSGDGNMIPFDMQDPLSRLVANIQARARGDIDSSPQRAAASNERRSKKENSAKGSEEANKYYRQLKGIEMDCTEISKRIIAWKRLNQDALADYGYAMTSFNYTPTSCSKCAPSVTYSLLELVHALLSCNIETVVENSVLDRDFVSCLFDDQSTDSSGLAELKRSVLVTIAKRSSSGSEMILKELMLRMNGGKDPISAEILGNLLQNEVRNHESFVNLAVTMLGT